MLSYQAITIRQGPRRPSTTTTILLFVLAFVVLVLITTSSTTHYLHLHLHLYHLQHQGTFFASLQRTFLASLQRTFFPISCPYYKFPGCFNDPTSAQLPPGTTCDFTFRRNALYRPFHPFVTITFIVTISSIIFVVLVIIGYGS